ncbi:MAG: winged helix-turn-helix domain-containing protein [Pyrinomonadaceae bacterium]
MSANTSLIYKFQSFELDPVGRMLLHNGRLIAVAPKPFEILLTLIQRHGQIVSKEEMIRLIWADAFIEESNIAQNIFLLRKLLGQEESGRSCIETIPRRGYRFVAKVREIRNSCSQDNGGAHSRGRAKEVTGRAAAPQNKAPSPFAVLPLTCANANQAAEDLADTITEGLINHLSQSPHLRVAARALTCHYRGSGVNLRQAAGELEVEMLLTGRVIVRGDALNVQIELIHAADLAQFWGNRYSSCVANAAEVQREISHDVSTVLKSALTGEGPGQMSAYQARDPEAYQSYLKGCYHRNKWTLEGLQKGIEYFQTVTAANPGFAPAYAGLAECYILSSLLMDANSPPDRPGVELALGQQPPLSSAEARAKAKAAVRQALKIDDTLLETHLASGLIKYCVDSDWLAAEREYRHAIKLKPNNLRAHRLLSICLLTAGRVDEALAEARVAEFDLSLFTDLLLRALL